MWYDSAVVTAFFSRTVSAEAEQQRQRALPAVVMMPMPNKCFSFASPHAKFRKRVVPVCKPNPSQWKSFSLGIRLCLFLLFFLLYFPRSQTRVSFTRKRWQKVLQTIIPNRQRRMGKAKMEPTISWSLAVAWLGEASTSETAFLLLKFFPFVWLFVRRYFHLDCPLDGVRFTERKKLNYNIQPAICIPPLPTNPSA